MIRKKKSIPGKKPAGRKVLREKIDALALIEALEQHILGRTEMTATQVNAALALLKKTLPDMANPARRKKNAKTGAGKTAGRVRHEDALLELE